MDRLVDRCSQPHQVRIVSDRDRQDARKIIKRLAALKSLRRPHEEVWRSASITSYPLRAARAFVRRHRRAAGAGEAQFARLPATDAVRILASAIMSGLTPKLAMVPARYRQRIRGRTALAGRLGASPVGKHPHGEL